ncbi:response regulator [Paraflavisolibacter sp. H34]|uniref:response regulator n=1 Tax=Huijunlia imazamoxiresistens TaxID=3127457 RepID=UPI003018D013
MPFIFLADADADDRFLLQEALFQAGSPYDIREARDGEQALRDLTRLKQEGALPSLIVLDPHMPRKNGCHLLRALGSDELLSAVPVVVYTTVAGHLDPLYLVQKEAAFRDHLFIGKPSRAGDLEEVAGRMLAACQIPVSLEGEALPAYSN